VSAISQFIAGRPRSQLLMCGALGLVIVSQFFMYANDQASAMLTDMTNTDVYTGMIVFGAGGAVGTGWVLHPQAYVLLPVLLFVFLRHDFDHRAWFQRFGYWLGAVLMFFTMTPATPLMDNSGGAQLGFMALGLAIVAAWLHGRERKTQASLPQS
jgi:hypothetical protein